VSTVGEEPVTAAVSRASKVIATVGTRTANLVLGVAASIVVARALHPAGRGQYYVLVTAATVAMTIGHGSLDKAHLYLWSVGTDRGSLAANALVLSMSLGLIVAPVSFLLIVLLGPNVVPVAGYDLLAVALLSVPLRILMGYLVNLLILADRIHWANTVAVIGSVVQCGALLIAGATGRLTVGAVIYTWALANLPSIVIALVLVRPRLDDCSAPLARQVISLGLRYHLGTCAMYLLLRVDIFLLNGTVSRSDVGLYSLAVTIAELAYLVTDSVAHVMLPSQVAGSLEESSQVTAHAVRLNIVASSLCVLGVALVAPLVVPFVYGRDFGGAVAPLLLIMPGIVALAVARPVAVFLTRTNRPLAMSAVSGGAMCVNVVLNLMLIPHFGVEGAAVASTIAYLGVAAVFVGWFLRCSGAAPRELIPRVADVQLPCSELARRCRLSLR
jgi:O-antigen/teichoic acid export membrane protein